MRKLSINLVGFASLFVLLSGNVYADCRLKGYVVRVATFTSATHVYFRPTHTSPYYFRGVTNSHMLANAMYHAYKGKSRILIKSDASTCPVVGGSGEIFVGVVETVGLGY